MLSTPTANDVALLLRQTLDSETQTQLTVYIDVVGQLVRAYTRGVGFDANGNPADDLKSVIMLATLRLWQHPSQLPVKEQYGAIMVDYRAGFQGFTLAEQTILNGYRVRAQ